eukprot:13660-Heterococcus_DN1.PRE.2
MQCAQKSAHFASYASFALCHPELRVVNVTCARVLSTYYATTNCDETEHLLMTNYTLLSVLSDVEGLIGPVITVRHSAAVACAQLQPAKGAKTVRMLCDHNVKKKQWMRHNKLRDECASQHTPRRGLRTASAAVRPTNALTNKICKVQEIELGATKQTYPIMCHVTDHVTVCPLLTAVTAAVASSSLFAASLCLISISIVIIRVYELMTNATVTTAVVT